MLIRGTPFHPRTEALNQTGLWSHWGGYLHATQYGLSEKFEYFAIRNRSSMWDTSPLYKYRITGRDSARFLSGVLARDIRTARPGRAQYTMWCDDDGHVIEDGVILRMTDTEFLLSSAEPNMAYIKGLVGYADVDIEDVTDEMAVLAVQGPRSRDVLGHLSHDVTALGYFHLTETKLGGVEATVSRTGFTGELGYEIWVGADDALVLWDAVNEAGAPYGQLPVGLTAVDMARLEAGLLLLDVDFSSSRYAWTDADRSSPVELGFSWWFATLAEDDRNFIGRSAIERQLAEGTPWVLRGLMVDWQSWDDLYRSNGLEPAKNHVPVHGDSILYNDDEERVGYVSSFMYSPMVQRHIALARVRPEMAAIGTEVNMEYTLNHAWHSVKGHVTKLPFYNPPHKTA